MVTTQQPSTKQDILQHLLKQGQATAHQLAAELDISPQAIRRHLKDLETDELISYQTIQVGMGRPQHVYQLSNKGRDRLQRTLSDRFGDSHGQFAVSLLGTLAETVGYDQMSSILRKQWERKALEYRDLVGNGSLQERVANLVELRKAEGYMAEWYPVEPSDADKDSGSQFILTEHNCAISNVAESFPSICGHELEMFATVLPDCKVERTHWLIDGEHRCGYLVQARFEKSNA
ncbi:iron-sulfur cluster biosynthesis transcriptional regulator SufR [Chroococcidiopsis sp. CCMEE 29]|uniref:iron-sulfur cluster biosynthesis transcriptional regulator SufR n=1 Tax=Chroococcidiopsis sp. CCMEE 29 TaxID=155894 RepID=UPI002020A17E|nr:iron-sulfur cluster biosynthesis transcriptional regulator SufR [Chroococcidiopsis sp. CCMEE 29]